MEQTRIDPQDIIRLYEQRVYGDAAGMLLRYYESGGTNITTNIATKLRRPSIIQRLGYQLSQDPETLKRLEAVAPNVLAGERVHLLWFVPELFEKGLGEEPKGMYSRVLKMMMHEFGTNSLEGIVQIFDEANKMEIRPTTAYLQQRSTQ